MRHHISPGVVPSTCRIDEQALLGWRSETPTGDTLTAACGPLRALIAAQVIVRRLSHEIAQVLGQRCHRQPLAVNDANGSRWHGRDKFQGDTESLEWHHSKYFLGQHR